MTPGAGHIAAGRYPLLVELGRGGVCSTHLALAPDDPDAPRLVAIKKLHPACLEERDFLSMYLDEATLAERLVHPCIERLFAVLRDDGSLVFEFLDGQPLHRIRQAFHRRGGLPLGLHLRILCDALDGLHHGHELRDGEGQPLGVVHRDLTAGSLFVTYEGLAKVTDFGCGRLFRAPPLRSGSVMGKVLYISPEQVRGQPLDRRCDIFAAGLLLWEALAGQRVWRDMSDFDVVQRLASLAPLRSPREVNPAVSEALEAVCRKALAPLRDDRYATALAMKDDLEQALAALGEPCSRADVGRALIPVFAGKRASLRAAIDAQARALGLLLPALPADAAFAGHAEVDPAQDDLAPEPKGSPYRASWGKPTQPAAPPPPAPPEAASRSKVVLYALAGLLALAAAALKGWPR